MDLNGEAVANKALVIHNPELTLEQKVVGLLMCIAQEKKVDVDRALAGSGVSFLQLNLLHALSKAPENTLTVGRLKSVMIDDSPNVSRALGKLADAGLVAKRRSDEDERTVFVTITEAGERMHVHGDERLLGQLSTGLDHEDLKSLFELLAKL
jgi:DNA-binding MarR family transcriptional regulator